LLRGLDTSGARTPGGTPGGELLERYSCIDLKFNVGLTDAAFGF
jgi:hypothetical protein